MIPTSTISKTGNGRTALFAGSFNPFTIGHADIVERALHLFDRIIIAVGVNKSKQGCESDDNVETIRRLYASEPHVTVKQYCCLTVDFARECEAGFLLRGVRSAADFEYERNIAEVNRQLSGIETVLLLSRPELAAVSSSMVRELQAFGRDVSNFLPKPL